MIRWVTRAHTATTHHMLQQKTSTLMKLYESRNPGKIPENLQLNDELTPMLVCPFWSIFFDVCRKRVGLICSPFPENDGNFWIRILLPLLRRKWAYRRLFIHFIRFFPIPEHFYLQTAYGSYGSYASHPTSIWFVYLLIERFPPLREAKPFFSKQNIRAT